MEQTQQITSEQERLFEQNIKIAYTLAWENRKNILPSDFEDMQQECLFGLYQAAVRFDPDRGFTFSTFAYKTIRLHLSGWLRDYWAHKDTGLLSLDKENEQGSELYACAKSSDKSIADQLIEKEDIEDAMRDLTPFQREIIVRTYFGDETLTDISRELGISRQSIFNSKTYAFKKMRNALERKNRFVTQIGGVER